MPNNDSTSPILRLDGIWNSICKRANISFVVVFQSDFAFKMTPYLKSDWNLPVFGSVKKTFPEPGSE
jgi:hypothetical protein